MIAVFSAQRACTHESYMASVARLDEKYTLKDRFQNRVYVFKASGVRSDEKIYIERLFRKSCL